MWWTLKEKLFSSLDFDTQINSHDVRLVHAIANFNNGDFANCITHLNQINTDLSEEIRLPNNFPPQELDINDWKTDGLINQNDILLEELYSNITGWNEGYASWDYNVNSLTGIDSIMWMIDLLQLVLW